MQKNTSLAKVMSAGVSTLTRTELIDLVMEEMIADLDAELKDAHDKLEAIDKQKYTFEQIKHLLVGRGAEFELDVATRCGKPQHAVSLGYEARRIAVSPKDPMFADRIKETLRLQNVVNKLAQQKNKIESNRKQFKVEVTKRILEATAEGRNVLQQLTALKAQMRNKLQA
jgi:hypothetical protein